MPGLDSSYRLILAKVPNEPWYESIGGNPRRCKFDISRPQIEETYVDFVQRIMSDDAMKTCSFVVTTSERVHF